MNEVSPADGESLASAGVWCAEYELSHVHAGMRAVLPYGGEESVRVLARLHGAPLGYLDLAARPSLPDSREVRARILQSFASEVRDHLREENLLPVLDGLEPDDALPSATSDCPNSVVSDEFVSVVICTRNRSRELADCLRRIRALTYPHLEIIVVDNAPSDESSAEVVRRVAAEDPRFRYVREPRPGLSRARNRGLSVAKGRLVAYTDDDVTVDPQWVQGLVKGFSRAFHVGCVTGLVCTAAVSGAAEAYFDARAASWSSRMVPQVFDLAERSQPDPLYPYSAGIFGTGANFAFDRDVVLELGGFDEALGAGTPTRGGEDLDIFVRILNAGRAIAYEPSAIVWHHHRADMDGLRKQLFGYGTGLTAFITKCLVTRDTRRAVLRRIPMGARRMTAIRSTTDERLRGRYRRPRGALAREVAGFAAGPWLYARSRREARREARRSGVQGEAL